MSDVIEDATQRAGHQIAEIIRAMAAQNSSKRKAKSWGHVKIKLNFRDGLISNYEVIDKTIVKVGT